LKLLKGKLYDGENKCPKELEDRDKDEPGSILWQVLHKFGSSLIIEARKNEETLKRKVR